MPLQELNNILSYDIKSVNMSTLFYWKCQFQPTQLLNTFLRDLNKVELYICFDEMNENHLLDAPLD